MPGSSPWEWRGVIGTVQTGAVMGLELGVLRGLRGWQRERWLRRVSSWLKPERRRQLAAAAVVKVSAAVALTVQPVAFPLVQEQQ